MPPWFDHVVQRRAGAPIDVVSIEPLLLTDPSQLPYHDLVVGVRHAERVVRVLKVQRHLLTQRRVSSEDVRENGRLHHRRVRLDSLHLSRPSERRLLVDVQVVDCLPHRMHIFLGDRVV